MFRQMYSKSGIVKAVCCSEAGRASVQMTSLTCMVNLQRTLQSSQARDQASAKMALSVLCGIRRKTVVLYQTIISGVMLKSSGRKGSDCYVS